MSGARSDSAAGDPAVERELEQRVTRALHASPPRRAPASLERRVLQEIGRRASLPWWRSKYSRWPRAAQAGFGLACAAALLVVAAGGAALSGGMPAAAPWSLTLLTLFDVTGELQAALMRAVPPGWLHGAIAVGALLYAALFGLGATAFRTLYLEPKLW